jgi:hypothetical protein
MSPPPPQLARVVAVATTITSRRQQQQPRRRQQLQQRHHLRDFSPLKVFDVKKAVKTTPTRQRSAGWPVLVTTSSLSLLVRSRNRNDDAFKKRRLVKARATASSSSSSSSSSKSKEVDIASKIYSVLSLSIFAALAMDVGLNFLAFLLAWVSKHDVTFFTTNVSGFWTEKLCVFGFVILLLMDFKAVATRQIGRARKVLRNIKYAKETTVESIEQTRNVEKFLRNVYLKSAMEIFGGAIALIGCLRTASPSLAPRSGVFAWLPASVGPAIALFFGHAIFMLVNTNVVSQSADITTPFPSQIRKTIATFDAMLAALALCCAAWSTGWKGLVASSLFLLFSVYFTYENEIKKKAKEMKKQRENNNNNTTN